MSVSVSPAHPPVQPHAYNLSMTIAATASLDTLAGTAPRILLLVWSLPVSTVAPVLMMKSGWF